MGSCLSKPSSNGKAKKVKQIPHDEEKDEVFLQKHESLISFKEDAESKDAGSAVPSRHDAHNGPSLTVQAEKRPSDGSAPPPISKDVECPDLKLPPDSPSMRKPSPSPASPDPRTVSLPAQTPVRRKYSADFPMNSFRNSSSPCRSLLHKAPSSPGGIKKSASSHRNEEDDCKFPSSARKQWLAQARRSRGEDDLLTIGGRATSKHISKDKTNSNVEVHTLTNKEEGDPVAKDLCHRRTGKSNGEMDVKTSVLSSKGLDSPHLISNTVESRTNSMPRDLSPAEILRSNKARPFSPLKKSPSIKDATGPPTEGPYLMRSSSGKVSSPIRTGICSTERPDISKARVLHKQSLSKEHIMNAASELSTHKRSSSKDSVLEYSSDIIRKPSPPKKSSFVVPSSASSSVIDAGRLNMRRPLTPSKDNVSLHKFINQDPSAGKAGKSSAQRSLNTSVDDSDSLISGTNKNLRRRDRSPLRRGSNGMTSLHSSARNNDRIADISINSDTSAASHFELVGKDISTRTRRATARAPLKEVNDNVKKALSLKPAAKENGSTAEKTRDIFSVPKDDFQQPRLKENLAKFGKVDEKALDSLPNNLAGYVKDPLEMKAENLVMGGKSVLSAFKALEEYKLKHSMPSSELHQGGAEEDVWYSREHSYAADKDNFSQPLQSSKDMLKGLQRSNLQESHGLPRSRSTKRSCEQFLFPDAQSLLLSENHHGLQLEGGMAIPASISKACSILRAVADLNMGNPTYTKRKEEQNEIEMPNLLSFQFGEGDCERPTVS
ncbi:hypothetical protein KP509_20G065800 [Ceratopteris richardii]|uniref:Uncharacterized protein n=1 Tax=Ceratopteris richardii TaxID=49495 RepID=A0A8T2SHT4_CERRI|nr:hypothetical protein KP509_20G065800 [Ceratopteris richardii]